MHHNLSQCWGLNILLVIQRLAEYHHGMFTKYLDPKNDLAFKKIFGQEKHKNIPINFLNAVFALTDNNKILDLEFINPTLPPEIQCQKESVVDVLVKDQEGQRYIVEMQVSKTPGFEKRAQYYAAKAYCSQLDEGEQYKDLKRVIFLAITSYVVFPTKKDYKSEHVILDKGSFENDLKDFSFTFVELPKFTKREDDLHTIEDQWYYFFKHALESNQVFSSLKSNSDIQQAYTIVERFNWTKQELQYYESNMKAVLDAKCRLEGARDEAREEGMREGMREGKLQGLQEGKREEQQRIIRALLEKSFSLNEISALTGYSETDILDCSHPVLSE